MPVEGKTKSVPITIMPLLHTCWVSQNVCRKILQGSRQLYPPWPRLADMPDHCFQNASFKISTSKFRLCSFSCGYVFGVFERPASRKHALVNNKPSSTPKGQACIVLNPQPVLESLAILRVPLLLLALLFLKVKLHMKSWTAKFRTPNPKPGSLGVWLQHFPEDHVIVAWRSRCTGKRAI